MKLVIADAEIPVLDFLNNLTLNEIDKAMIIVSDENYEVISKFAGETISLVDEMNTPIFTGIIDKVSHKFDGTIKLELSGLIKKLDRVLFSKDGNYRVSYTDEYAHNIVNEIVSEFDVGYVYGAKIDVAGNFESKLAWLKKISSNLLWGIDVNGNYWIGTPPDGVEASAVGNLDVYLDDNGRINVWLRGSDARILDFTSEFKVKLPNSLLDPDSGGVITGGDSEYYIKSHYGQSANIRILIDQDSDFSTALEIDDNGYQGSNTSPELYRTVKFFLPITKADGQQVIYLKLIADSAGELDSDTVVCTISCYSGYDPMKTITVPSYVPENSDLRIYYEASTPNSCDGSVTGSHLGWFNIFRYRDTTETAVGTERSVNTSDYVSFEETIGGWNPGDQIRLRANSVNCPTPGSEDYIGVRNFRVKDIPFFQTDSVDFGFPIHFGIYGTINFYGFTDDTQTYSYTRIEIIFERYISYPILFRSFDITQHIINVINCEIDYSKLINRIHVLGKDETVYYMDEDVESQAKYFTSESVYTDYSLSFVSEAEKTAKNIIARFKEPAKRIEVEIRSELVIEKIIELGQYVVINGFDERIDGSYRIVEIKNLKADKCILVLSNNVTLMTDYLRRLKDKVDNLVKY